MHLPMNFAEVVRFALAHPGKPFIRPLTYTDCDALISYMCDSAYADSTEYDSQFVVGILGDLFYFINDPDAWDIDELGYTEVILDSIETTCADVKNHIHLVIDYLLNIENVATPTNSKKDRVFKHNIILEFLTKLHLI